MTSIEWTDETWNPITGCTKVSPGCAHCYAETVADRFWATQYPRVPDARPCVLNDGFGLAERSRRFTDVQCHPDRLEQPLRWRKPRRVFVNSMSDLFHEDVPDAFIDRVFAIMALSPSHTFQVLTKRPDRMRVYMDRWLPRPNVWLGVSVEDQKRADERIPLLLQTPACVRFLSCEPLLGPIALSGYLPGADWVIVGGESGSHARPCDLAWIRSIIGQCRSTDVPCFVKQVGAHLVNSAQPDGDLAQAGITGKGGNMSEWPDDVCVREYPKRVSEC